jgi:SAP domain
MPDTSRIRDTSMGPSKIEICTNCKRQIGRSEQAYVFKAMILCAECDRQLRKLEMVSDKKEQPKEETMFGGLQKKDWQSSPAYLLLMSKFRNGDSPTRYRDADYWEAALKEKPAKVIEQFIKEEMLEPAALPELLNYKFKASDLKSMLKEKGLKVSGRKEELIQRLIDNDANAMSELTKDLDLYRCTAAGKHLVEQYLEGERIKRGATEQETLNLLAGEEYSKAVRVVAQYEATQVFARGIGIDWKNYDGTSDVESLRVIFNTTPTILKGVEENRLRQLRPAAGMMQLWGTSNARHWLPEGFETGIHLDGDAACRMLMFHASYLRNIEGYIKGGVKTVEVLGVNDGISCSECRKISGKKYRIENVPEIPYAKCTCGIGCRCTTVVGEFR